MLKSVQKIIIAAIASIVTLCVMAQEVVQAAELNMAVVSPVQQKQLKSMDIAWQMGVIGESGLEPWQLNNGKGSKDITHTMTIAQNDFEYEGFQEVTCNSAVVWAHTLNGVCKADKYKIVAYKQNGGQCTRCPNN